MDESAYRVLPGITASIIKAGAVSMLHARHAAMGLVERTDSMESGSLYHLAALRDPAMSRLLVWCGVRSGKVYQKAARDNGEDNIITESQCGNMGEIMAAIRDDEKAQSVMAGCRIEVPIEWDDEQYGHAKARIDACGPRHIVELKTCSGAASERQMMSQFYGLGYHLQLGWYWHGYRTVTGGDVNAWVVAMPPKPPFYCAVIRVPDTILRAGYEQAADIAQRYRICERTGIWPGPHDRVIDYSLPAWAGGSEEDMSDGEMEASEL